MSVTVHPVDPRRTSYEPSHHNAAVRAPSRADYQRLRDAVGVLSGGLLGAVHASLPESVSATLSGTIGRHQPTSTEPWQAEAAAVYWRVHFGVRRLENTMRRDAGLAERTPPRGGTFANTRSALSAVAGLGAAVCATALVRAANRVETWVEAARQIRDVDEQELWVPVPRVPGALPPACPYCRTYALRMALRRQEVRCFNPACYDLDGHRPVARMETGALNGTALLVFRDTTTVHFRPVELP